MRSHAKAPSVGSSAGGGRVLGSPGRAPALLILALCLAASACLLPGSALAAETRPQIGSFGPDGTNTTQFGSPGAIAVDQGTHDIYVADYGNGKIEKFDENNAPADFSALGSNEIGGFSFFGGEALDQIAVDSTSHDFYVADYGNGVIKAFQGNGEPREFSAGPGAGSNELPQFSEVCGVAVDSNGDIYMGDFGTGVHVFAPDGEELTTFSSPFGVCNVAVDAAGALYVSYWVFSFAPGIEKLTPSQFPVSASTTYSSAGSPTKSAAFALSVEPTSGDVYANFGGRVGVYGDSGALRYEFGEGAIEGSEGVAVDGSTEKAYAADPGSGKVRVFGSPVQLPNVVTEDADGLSDSAATLHGTVNPEDGQLTDCHFDFVPASQFEADKFDSVTPSQEAPCDPDAGSIPADSSAHAVSAEVTGLDPATTYYMRLVAGTAEGTSNGPARTLTTASGPPAVSEQSVETVGAEEVTVSAKVNPKGAKTSYHVEYGPTASYGQSTPQSAPIGFSGDESKHGVNVHIGGLAPGSAYHFRFVATSLAGQDEGPDTAFATYSTTASFAPCPNDQFRTGFGAALPDCRAYEQATPTDKHGASVQGYVNLIEASSAGDRVTFYLNGGLPTSGGSSSLSAFMASRGPAGWSSDGLLPASEPGLRGLVMGWSDDLGTTATISALPGETGGIYLRDSQSGASQLATDIPLSFGAVSGYLAGFAADTSHLIFESRASAAPGAVEGEGRVNLYDLDHGAITLVGRIPAGSATSCDDENGPACVPAPNGAFAGPYRWGWSGSIGGTEVGGVSDNSYTENTISRDGSKVFFTQEGPSAAAGNGRLFMREDGVRTVQVSASQRSVPDPNGEKPAAFLAATADGSKVFFTSCEKLTDDSTASSDGEHKCPTNDPNRGNDLYLYETETGELTDLTVDSNAGDPGGAGVQGLAGISADGSYVYFAAKGVLAPGATSGKNNLYLRHAGTTTFIATLKEGDTGNWQPQAQAGEANVLKESRVTQDGKTLLFGSRASLTGYDNVSAACGNLSAEPCREFFRYTAPDEDLICVSCNPTGVPARGDAMLGSKGANGVIRGFVGATFPQFSFLTRNLSADGKRAFFESSDALVPTDTNGVNDVYEWEARGSGSCESESQDGGCIYLLSSGRSPRPSFFGDASADGDHVFVFTSQRLVPGDRDDLTDIYDAGVGGGLAAQHELTPPTCSGAACQANPPPPPEVGTASASFRGPGNAQKPPAARKCPKGKRRVRSGGKASCRKAHKQHKRHTNRGGSK